MLDPNCLCMGCMRELPQGMKNCPHCGFSLTEYDQTRNSCVLPAFTILNGKYLVGKVLGIGGFGITYLAFDLNLQIPLAIKEYFPNGLVTRDGAADQTEVEVFSGTVNRENYGRGLAKFQIEAKNLAKFQQMKGIVSVTDFFFENGTGYLVMEYVDGISLKDYLRQNQNVLSEKETLQMMQPVLTALSQVHRTGMIHRDISPDNIMVSVSGELKLIDFGAARTATGTESKSLTVLLKHGYAPVEQYQTKGKQGPWTDVYAVCATLYRMLSGRIPDASTNRVQQDKVVPLEGLPVEELKSPVSPRVSAAVQKGLAVWAEERYQSIEELMKDLYGADREAEAPDRERAAITGDMSGNTWNHGKEPEGFRDSSRLWMGILIALSVILAVLMLALALVLKERMNEESQTSGAEETVTREAAESEEAEEETDEETEETEYVCSPVSGGEAATDELEVLDVLRVTTSAVMEMGDNLPEFAWDYNMDTVYQAEEKKKMQAFFDGEQKIHYVMLRMGNWRNEESYYGSGRPKKLQLRAGEEKFVLECEDARREQWFEITPAISCSELTARIQEHYGNEEIYITDFVFYGE